MMRENYLFVHFLWGVIFKYPENQAYSIMKRMLERAMSKEMTQIIMVIVFVLILFALIISAILSRVNDLAVK
jgi:predicted PurR-regulated permease PerM